MDDSEKVREKLINMLTSEEQTGIAKDTYNI